mgnify:CR=1 FL=1
MVTRRSFIRKTSALAAAAYIGPTVIPAGLANAARKVAPSDQLNIGVIGAKGMGWSNTRSAMKIPGVNLIGICDIDQNVIAERKAELDKNSPGSSSKVKAYNDYRRMLDEKDIDVVIVGTPDHWHALQMIHACEAGKDVYVEKPVGNSIEECRRMVAAQKRYNRAVQVGQWQRSQQHFRDAVDFVQSGQLGNIRTVKVWCYQGWMKPGPVVPDSDPPAGVDYRQWLGPAPIRPFNASRFHFNFRWFWDYAGGLMTDWGVHLIDYALLGMKAELPRSIVGLGGRFAYPDLYEETPDTLTTLYEFDSFNMVWDSAMGIDNGSYGRDHGIAYIGNNGTLVLDRGGWEVIEEKRSEKKVSKPLTQRSDNGLDKHWENFVEVVKSRQFSKLNCPIEAGAHVATVAQMGNISYLTGQKLMWDKSAGKFTDEAVNRKYLEKPYHNGYKLPKV